MASVTIISVEVAIGFLVLFYLKRRKKSKNFVDCFGCMVIKLMDSWGMGIFFTLGGLSVAVGIIHIMNDNSDVISALEKDELAIMKVNGNKYHPFKFFLIDSEKGFTELDDDLLPMYKNERLQFDKYPHKVVM